jgi:long-chain acyl-CoA synthetase
MAGLTEHSRSQPDKPAVAFGDSTFVETYGELEARSCRVAHALRSLGLQEGDCVAILVGNTPPLFDLYWATQRVGLYLTTLNHHSNADELAYILDNCDARLLIATAELGALAEGAARAASALQFRYAIGDIPGFGSWDAAMAAAPDAPLDRQSAGSVMIYSSGTTGRPKGVRRPLPQKRFDDQRYADATTLVMRTFGFRQNDVYLCPAPLYHAGPLRSCTAMQMLGATVIVVHRFDAEGILRIIDERQVTVAQLVPTHFKRLLELPAEIRARYRLDSLRVVVHSAAPCPPEVKRAMIDWWGPILLEYYAGTEGGGVLINSQEWLQRPGSVGRAWQGLSVAILDEQGQAVSTPRTEGSIYFRNHPGALSNFTYHKDADKTAAAYRGEWFTLGDIGYLDEDGFLYLTDRQSNMIISGGVNIYPQEVEDILAGHPKVRDVAVVGVPDADMGESVKAVVIPIDGVHAEKGLEEELIAYARARIASYKCPRSIDFVDHLPRTATGKLQKRLVRDRYWKGRASRLA